MTNDIEECSGYKALYHLLFNAITDAVRCLEDTDYGTARRLLIEAQQQAEELYIAEPVR